MIVPRTKKINTLTSMRFFAASLIVLGHGGSKSFFDYQFNLFDLRYAVSFFFVLSGFILSHAYQHLDWRTNYRSFISARIARIWPAHIITALLAVLTVAPITSLDTSIKAAVNAVLLQSMVPLKDWYYSVNAVSWSISTELFFYAVFPFALVLARKKVKWLLGIAALFLACALGLACMLNLPQLETAPGITSWGLLYISPATRIAEFLVGMAAYPAALWLFRHNAEWPSVKKSLFEISVIAIALGMMVTCTWISKEPTAPIPPQISVWLLTSGPFVSFALLIAVFYGERGLFSTILNWRPLVYLGEISFSIYLVHQLVIRYMFANFREAAESHRIAYYVLYWAASITIAALIYHVFEAPLRPMVRKLLDSKKPRSLPEPAPHTNSQA